MPLRPLIVFPQPVPVDRDRLPPGFQPVEPFSTSWGRSHVVAPLRRLQTALDSRSISVVDRTEGIAPEDILVLETIGNVADFKGAVARIAGLEWLVSNGLDAERASPDDDDDEAEDAAEPEEDEQEANKMFALATNAEALRELLSLWRRSQRGEELPKGLKAWKQVFAHLKDVRQWSVRDRIEETGIVEDWQNAVDGGQRVVTFALEFWYRASPESRRRAWVALERAATNFRGTLDGNYVHQATRFHGGIAHLPRTAVAAFLKDPDNASFLQHPEVRYFRPQGQSAVPLGPIVTTEAIPAVQRPIVARPVAALFDGLPIENHDAYGAWLRVDDPDGWGETYVTGDRQHGTAMASLIVRGDLSGDESPLASTLYVRPILRPDPVDQAPRYERVPKDLFPFDLLERAVRRMKVGLDGSAPTAPSVQVINLSIGDPSRPFLIDMSPWARMVDFLSHEYNLLFIISAGNHLSLPIGANVTQWEALTPEGKQRRVLLDSLADRRNRRLLSPAESINAITVGAAHSDNGPMPTVGAMTTLPTLLVQLPSAVSALGPGYARSVKPDLLFPGGRQLFDVRAGRLDAVGSARTPGHKIAVPGAGGSANAVAYSRGTSNAAALATRTAVQIVHALEALPMPQGFSIREHIPVLTKALLAHGASTAEVLPALKAIFDPDGDEKADQFRKKFVTPFVGYGSVNTQRSIGGDDNRATIIGWGELRDKKAHEFRLPLPASLSGAVGDRRITMTLAWLSPTNSASRDYRSVKLWLSSPAPSLSTARAESESRQSRRGTVQHEIWAGRQAHVFQAGEEMVVRVNCRKEGSGSTKWPVRYGLVVSLEASMQIGQRIYQEVRSAIRVRTRVAV